MNHFLVQEYVLMDMRLPHAVNELQLNMYTHLKAMQIKIF